MNVNMILQIVHFYQYHANAKDFQKASCQNSLGTWNSVACDKIHTESYSITNSFLQGF